MRIPNLTATAGVFLVVAAVLAGCESSHKAVMTDKLEPYQCGTVQRLHTYQGVFLASQPQPDDFEQAKKGGVKTVINLRTRDEIKEFDEEFVVKSLGLEYHNVPISGADDLTDGKFDETRKLLKDVDRPVLLHCASSNRVGAVWLAYRALDGGLSIEEAKAEAKIVGLKSPALEAKAIDYVKRKKG